MRPTQVLDMHTDLVTRMDDLRFTLVIRGSFTADLEAVDVMMNDTQRDTVESNARYLQERHYAHVRAAETYHVTDDMVDLLMHVAEQTDPTDTWQHRLAPSPAGIVRFDKPIVVHDIRGRVMKAHWLVWGPATAAKPGSHEPTPVTMMTWYNDGADPDEVGLTDVHPEIDPEFVRTVGRWLWIGAEYLQDGIPLGHTVIPVPEHVRQEVIAEGDTPADTMTHLPKYAYALWLLLGQTITATAVHKPERAAGRRAIRKGLPPRVTVVSLRRKEYRPGEGESVVEWQHQWIVRQHLRWQPRGPRLCHDVDGGEHHYGPVEAEPGLLVRRCVRPGCAAHLARITIDPYVKGPEGKPLVQSAKVYKLEH